jgi:hypothetical protein
MPKKLPKPISLLIFLIFLIGVAYSTILLNVDFKREVPTRGEIETAINQAQYLYKLRKEEGVDFANGPCLTNALMPNWVVDIVHRPRIAIDELPENQCSSYREGKAKHLVELEIDGDLIRAK